MREDGILARPKRKFTATTHSDHSKASSNLLKRKFNVKKPNKVWTSDITYIATRQDEWLYVATVMDLCTPKIVWLAMRDDMSQQLVIDALNQAIERQQPDKGLILHSDRGSQYSSDAYRAILSEHGFRQSMSRKCNCGDNAPIESFFKTLKVELVYPEKYETHEEAKMGIFEYIEIYYNRQRMHSALNFQTPDAFEAIINQSYKKTITKLPV